MIRALKERIHTKKAKISIIGMGYVGLPLACAFARAGFHVHGIDIVAPKIRALQNGKSHIDDLSDADLKKVMQENRIDFSASYKPIAKSDCIIICVPTPLGKTKEPDLSYIMAAVEETCLYLKSGQLLVLESTTYPGTTEEYVAPLIKSKTKLSPLKDVLLGFSPERVDPANKDFDIVDIPKVVGGHGNQAGDCLEDLYQCIFGRVVRVSSAKAAEMVKLLENTFRSVNIGMINEMAIICHKLNVDIWEVIDAAATKPFGFMPFYPGPGIGGHCINIDSMYLAWKVRLHDYEPRLIELAQTINDSMPQWVIERVSRILNAKKKCINGAKVLVMGVSYKPNIQDIRESPSIALIKELLSMGANLEYHDPFVPQLKLDKQTLKSKPLNKARIDSKDIILITTAHTAIDYGLLVKSSSPVLDTRNALKKYAKKKHIHLL
ncbi:MAG: UDP-N-acetyl-D-glucosamine dehydrogenase [Candidatus Omnitrophota bacterium]